MFVKLLRSVAIGLIVGAILLVAMPSLRSLNPLSTPQFDSTDETPASYNLAVRRAAPGAKRRASPPPTWASSWARGSMLPGAWTT